MVPLLRRLLESLLCLFQCGEEVFDKVVLACENGVGAACVEVGEGRLVECFGGHDALGG